MDRQEIFDFLNRTTDIHHVKAFKQRWGNTSYSYINRERPDYGIMLLLSGQIDFIFGDECLSAKTGDLVFLPKHSHYEAVFHCELADTYDYLVNFDTATEFCYRNEPMKLSGNASYTCSDYFKQLAKESFSVNGSTLRKKGLLYLLFDAIISMQTKEDSALHTILDKAQDLLKKDYEISISDIAHACCTSESNLRRLFCQKIGMSPSKYRMQMKMNRAMYLLDLSDLSINEIAASLNFYDTAYFCKTFRAYTGMSPRQYALKKKL